ncbi:MAG: N-acetyl-gamma-glutamyl-phosphate reductase [Pseudomonadota bacterium]
MTLRVGLIGARGYVGRELLVLIARHPELELAYASSREWAGKPVAEMLETGNAAAFGGLQFEALDPDAAASRGADVVFLGLPNGKSAPFVSALVQHKPDVVIIDLSGDHRHEHDWVYGLPERNRSKMIGATRIANPGCYATAAQLAILPLKGLLSGPAYVFGISGWSGAGTTPSRKNDPEALKDNVIPYGLTGHAHEREIAAHSGEDIRFTPTVASFYRGLVVVVSCSLISSSTSEKLSRLYQDTFANEPYAAISEAPAEPAMAAYTYQCLVGLPQVNEDGRGVVITAALDNLLKGAASQAIQNLNIAFGWPENAGLGSLSSGRA